MRKIKVLENEIEVLRRELLGLQDYIFEKKFLSVEDAKRRDYIVRTNYIGKLTDKNIIKDFKKDIEKFFGDTFESVCNKILNYENIDYNAKLFREALRDYEYKQIVVDTYKKKD